MLLVSFLGGFIVPFTTGLLTYDMIQRGNDPSTFTEYTGTVTFFFQLLIGTMLIGLLGTYSFHREFQEKTLKSYITIPVSRLVMFFSKQVVLLIWTLSIMAFVFLLSLGIALPLGITNITFPGIIEYFWKIMAGGLFTLLGCLPIILLTIIYRNYLVSIGVSIVITLVNTFVFRSKYITVFPWTSSIVIINPGEWSDMTGAALPVYTGWISFGIMTGLSLIFALIYIRRMEITD